MKIAIFGGSFNPIHKGHISMIEYLLEKFNFDKIIVVPIGIPSHKENILIDNEHRYNMCSLAFKNIEKVEVSRIEIELNKPAYTIETLIKLKEKYPQDEFYEIIGEDSADSFYKWKNYKKIIENSKVIVFKRKKSCVEDKIKASLSPTLSSDDYGYKKEFLYTEAPYFKFSSTEVREKIKKRESIKEMVSQEILEYIDAKKLYV